MRRSVRLVLQASVKKEEEQNVEPSDERKKKVKKHTKRSRKHIKIEYDEEESEQRTPEDEGTAVDDPKDGTFSLGKRKRRTVLRRGKAVKKTKSKKIKQEIKIEVNREPDQPPENWLEVYHRIKKMRKDNPAPVDEKGCTALNKEPVAAEVRRYQTLISLMLSSQTRDEMTAKAMGRLREHGLTVDNILATPEKELAELINNVSFFNRKADYIKRTTKMLKEQYNGDIPAELSDLLKLPGVGPKMAYLCMQCAWKRNVGIGVDTHVHRISNRLGWVSTSTPEATRMALEEWLPKEYWRPANKMLVGFGQTICRPIGPKCSTCLASDLCPTGKLNLAEETVGKKKRKKSGREAKEKKEKKEKVEEHDEKEKAEEEEKEKENGEKEERNRKKKKRNEEAFPESE